MRTNPSSETENNSTAETDEYYEELACQEEIYLERVEENLRAIAICELEVSQQAENIDELREYAADGLVEGDSDDPPLSQEATGA